MESASRRGGSAGERERLKEEVGGPQGRKHFFSNRFRLSSDAAFDDAHVTKGNTKTPKGGNDAGLQNPFAVLKCTTAFSVSPSVSGCERRQRRVVVARVGGEGVRFKRVRDRSRVA